MTAAPARRAPITLSDAVEELLSSKGIEAEKDFETGNRWYVDPETNASLNAVTTVLGATCSKPWLVAWAAGLAADFAVDNLGHVSASLALGGREAAVGLVKGAAQRMREEARERGTFVHDIVEALILDAPLPDFTDQPDVAPYADAFVDWCIQWQPRFLAAEATVAHPELGYAGTLDICAYLPALGRVLDIDVKSGKNLDADMVVQLAAYRECSEVWLPLGRKVRKPKTEGLAVLHLRPGRARLVEVTEEADEGAFAEFMHRLTLLRRFDVRPKGKGVTRYPLDPDGRPGSPWLEDIGGVPLWEKLANHGIRTLADLATQTEADLRSVDGIGPKRVEVYRAALAAHGLSLRGE